MSAIGGQGRPSLVCSFDYVLGSQPLVTTLPQPDPRSRLLQMRGGLIRRFLKLWGVAFLATTIVGGLFAIQQVLQQGVPFGRALVVQLPPWYSWAFLTPFVVETVLRLRPAWRIKCAALMALALFMFVAVHMALIVASLRGVGFFEGLTFGGAYGEMLVRRGATDIIIASLIVAVVLAVLYARRARAEELHRSQLARKAAEARLEALRIQLHPHFLLNTLNSISALAASGEQEATEQAIVETGELLREALRRPDLVPLEKELEYLRLYLRIMNLGRSRSDEVQLDISDDARVCPVPSFLLQPLVENALRHGRRPEPGQPRVTIRARCHGDVVEISVENPLPTGSGRFSDRGDGIGIQNTRTRLDALYGDRAELTIRSAEGDFRVDVRLPRDAHDVRGLAESRRSSPADLGIR